MAETTQIPWCDSTWNPWRGCDKVSAGCTNCYITTTMPFRTTSQQHGDPRVIASDSIWSAPDQWSKKPFICDDCGKAYPETMHLGKFEICPDCIKNGRSSLHRRRVFTLSMGDFFDPKVPTATLARALETIFALQNLNFLIVTKRPELAMGRLFEARDLCFYGARPWVMEWMDGRAPKNVWIIASAENQAMADKRIPELLRIPAVVRGLSCEPLLGPINLDVCWDWVGAAIDRTPGPWIDWVIVGGESGKDARPCNVEWIRSVKDQCQAAGVPVFVKQLGSDARGRQADQSYSFNHGCKNLHGDASSLILKHPKGGDPSEWPADLRVREFPSPF